MKHEQLLEVLKNIALGMHKLMGEDTEVALHDLKKKEMIYIANSYLSGRTLDYKISEMTSKAIIDMADEDGHLIGYSIRSMPTDHLRSSHFVFYEDGEPTALLCINQDTTKIEEMKRYLERMIMPLPREDDNMAKYDGDYIMKVTKQMIIETIDTMSYAEFKTKEGKLKLLKELHRQGVFNVRDSGPLVCKSLEISHTTLYNYLKELRKRGEINDIKAFH